MRDLLVHLDGSDEDETRLTYVEALVSPFDVHVTGLFTNAMPDPAMVTTADAGLAVSEVLINLERATRDKGAELAPRLSMRLQRLGSSTDLVRLDDVPVRLQHTAVSLSRTADLFVATMPYRPASDRRWDGLVETVLFGSGRGVLLVPPHHQARGPIQRILVAWTDTREAARAVAEAIPLLAHATRVDVVLVAPERGEHEAPAADIVRHLSRHGAKVELKIVAAAGRTVAQALIEQAQRGATDLIVMGAYGHSRMREWIVGGSTRDILETATTPVLMAH
jgi:nucleotide-binding universal stress UspA family protein